jgi:hypothetical protein
MFNGRGRLANPEVPRLWGVASATWRPNYLRGS